jgi:hypothetical protein
MSNASLPECAHCLVADETVDAVGECADRCTVHVHAACLPRRCTTAVWRKKHAHRSNDDPELCPRTGCVFFARDGTPCKREAVTHGACRLHANDAYVLRRMSSVLEEDLETGVACQTMAVATRDAGTQTTGTAPVGCGTSLLVVEALQADVGLLRGELARARETERALRTQLEDVARTALALLARAAA